MRKFKASRHARLMASRQATTADQAETRDRQNESLRTTTTIPRGMRGLTPPARDIATRR